MIFILKFVGKTYPFVKGIISVKMPNCVARRLVDVFVQIHVVLLSPELGL